MPFDELQQYGEMKAHEIQERRKRRKLERERALQNRKVKSERAPQLWQQLREAIEERIRAVNVALGESALECDNGRTDVVTVLVSHVPTNLSASFDGGSGRVTLTLDDHAESYDLEVVKGEVLFKAVGFFSPTQVAKMLVDKAATLVL